jgi:hypothetical protein
MYSLPRRSIEQATQNRAFVYERSGVVRNSLRMFERGHGPKVSSRDAAKIRVYLAAVAALRQVLL